MAVLLAVHMAVIFILKLYKKGLYIYNNYYTLELAIPTVVGGSAIFYLIGC
jgi:hypothetical protein